MFKKVFYTSLSIIVTMFYISCNINNSAPDDAGSDSEDFSHLPGLVIGDTLNAGEQLISSNRRYQLMMKPDGNLVIYKLNDRESIVDTLYSFATNGFPGNKLVFENNSNLVMYKSDMTPIWQSRTESYGGVNVELQDDGNLVMFDRDSQPVWDRGIVDTLPVIPSTPYSVGRGNELLPGELITSANGIYKLIYQGDGNLVLYNGSNIALWMTSTNGSACNQLVMQFDGNLVLYNSDNNAVWMSGINETNGKIASILQLNNDGNLVLYAEDYSVIWATWTQQP